MNHLEDSHISANVEWAWFSHYHSTNIGIGQTGKWINAETGTWNERWVIPDYFWGLKGKFSVKFITYLLTDLYLSIVKWLEPSCQTATKNFTYWNLTCFLTPAGVKMDLSKCCVLSKAVSILQLWAFFSCGTWSPVGYWPCHGDHSRLCIWPSPVPLLSWF